MKTLFLLATILASAATFLAQGPKDGRDADREAIKTEIGRITRAFIDRDIETVYKTHSQDWSGFLNDNQTEPIYGIDSYMKANGIPWPAPAGYKPTPRPDLKYTISNYMCVFVAQDIGVASFTLDYPRQDGVNFNKLRIMDVFAKRNGAWVQAASDTLLDPVWKVQQQQANKP